MAVLLYYLSFGLLAAVLFANAADAAFGVASIIDNDKLNPLDAALFAFTFARPDDADLSLFYVIASKPIPDVTPLIPEEPEEQKLGLEIIKKRKGKGRNQ